MTEYVILAQTHDDGTNNEWKIVGHAQARSARSALRDHLDGQGAGIYVAVPARSWKPVTVAVETKQTLRFS